jgi:hypothetical protein
VHRSPSHSAIHCKANASDVICRTKARERLDLSSPVASPRGNPFTCRAESLRTATHTDSVSNPACRAAPASVLTSWLLGPNGCRGPAQRLPKGNGSGAAGRQVEVDDGHVLRGEQFRLQVDVPLGHDDRVVAKDLLQLLDGAAGEDPLRGEGVPRCLVPPGAQTCCPAWIVRTTGSWRTASPPRLGSDCSCCFVNSCGVSTCSACSSPGAQSPLSAHERRVPYLDGHMREAEG